LNEAYDLRNYLKKLCLELSDLIEDRKLLIYMVRITSRLIDVVESVSTLNEVIINRCLGSEDTISRFKYLELKKQAL